MPAKKSKPEKPQPWTLTVEESGVRVLLRERAVGGPIYREVRLGKGKGAPRDQKSLGHRDRKLAEAQGRELARSIALANLTGTPGSEPSTLAHVFSWFRRDRLPLMSDRRRRELETTMQLFEEAWSPALRLEDISQTHVDQYVKLRRSGELVPRSRRPGPENRWKQRTVRDGGIHPDLANLTTIFNAAHMHRSKGRRLIPGNPLHGLSWPKEKNPRRPVASEERYRKTMEQVDQVDPMGRLRCMLALARHTARREDAICHLRVSDLLLTANQVRRALAQLGRDERLADHCPHGAIWWRREHDKEEFDEVAPLNADARAALEEYLRRNARVGNAWLFPGATDAETHLRRDTASKWLLRAEKAAGLPKLERGVWHPYRRLWASERRHLSDVDVAAAGGWRDTRALKQSYQHADAAGILEAVKGGRGRRR